MVELTTIRWEGILIDIVDPAVGAVGEATELFPRVPVVALVVLILDIAPENPVGAPPKHPKELTSQTPGEREMDVTFATTLFVRETAEPLATVETILSPKKLAEGAVFVEPFIVPPTCVVVLIVELVPKKVKLE